MGVVETVEMALKMNASSVATSDASFEAVARMRKQECILMSEIDRLRAERTVAENERDEANARTRRMEADCADQLEKSKVREKHALDVCRIVRSENERLRKAGASKEEAMHKQSLELRNEVRLTMQTSDQRREVAEANLEHQHNEIRAARAALQTAVEEHNMMAQEYYGTMEKFSQMNEELEYSQSHHDLMSSNCEGLEQELVEQGNDARRRLGDIHKERDVMRQSLELSNMETRQKSQGSLAVLQERLLSEQAEVVATRAKTERAHQDAESARTHASVLGERCVDLERRCEVLTSNLRESEDDSELKFRENSAQAAQMARLREELANSRNQVLQLNLQQDQMEVTLRSSVDWTKYREPAFLEASKFSKASLNTIGQDMYSGYCDMKDLRHEM